MTLKWNLLATTGDQIKESSDSKASQWPIATSHLLDTPVRYHVRWETKDDEASTSSNASGTSLPFHDKKKQLHSLANLFML